MSKGKELFKNTIIIAIGRISTQFISFFLLPLYTAILSPKDYGLVDLFNTGIALFLPLITLQIEQAIFRYLLEARDSIQGKIRIISSSCFFVTLECVAYSVVFLFIQNFIHFEFKQYIIMNVIANAFSIMLLQVARGFGNTVAYSAGSTISAISTISLNVLFLVVLKMGAEGMLLATFLGNLLCCIYLAITLRIWRYLMLRIADQATFIMLLKYSIPLVPHALSWWIVNASDRVIITAFLGVSANGMIAVAHKFPSVFTAAFTVFSLSWTESGALHLKEKDGPAFFERTMQTIFNLFLAIFLGVIAVMPFVFPLLVDSRYSDSYYQIPIFMLAAFFSIVVGLYNVVYTTYLMTKEIMKTTVFAGLVNMITSLLTINFIGIYSAALAAVVAYFAMSVYRYFDSRKYVILRLDKDILISGSIVTAVVFFAYYMRNVYLYRAIFIAVIVYSMLINRHLLKKLLNIANSYFRNRRSVIQVWRK